jgi:RNA polymerase sigma factor (sigma-70 family)
MLSVAQDTELTTSLIEGNQETWQDFYCKTRGSIALAVRSTLHRTYTPYAQEDVADYVQSVFVDLLENDKKLLRQYDPTRTKRDVYAWINYLARRTTLDRIRYRRSRFFTVELDADTFVSDEISPEERAVRAEQKRTLDAALTQLTAMQLAFYKLFWRQGLDRKEIAAKMGVQLGTIDSRSNRIQKQIVKTIKRKKLRGKLT